MFRRRAIIGAGEMPTPTPTGQIIYGVKLNRTLNNNAPLGASWATYTDDAVNFQGAYMDFTNDVFVDNGWYNRWPFNQIKPCIVNNGSVVGYLKKDDYTKYEDGTTAPITDRTAGNVMVEIPKIYYKFSVDNQYNYIQISNQNFSGACCLAHVYKGQELSKVYVDAYLSVAADFQTYGPYSVSGIEPTPANLQEGYRLVYPTMKTNRGDRCEPFTFNMFTLIGCLFAIMFKSTDSISSLGVGLSKYNEEGLTTGALNQKGFCYGENTNESGNTTLGRVKLFGMEDYYGARRTYFAGLYVDYDSHNLRIIDPYDSTKSYAPDDLVYFTEETNLPTDVMPLPLSDETVPIKLSGLNKLGFTRINKNIDSGATTTDTTVGFCNKQKFNTGTATKVGFFSYLYNESMGVYNFRLTSTGNTTRQSFRCIYFPQ